MSKDYKSIIPFIFLLILTLFTNYLVTEATDPAILKQFKIPKCIADHFQLAAVLLSLVATSVLLALSRKFSVGQVSKQLFIFAALMLGILFYISLPLRSSLLLTECTMSDQSKFMQIYRNLDLIALFGLLTVWPSGMILCFYGYANDNYTFREAVRYYPIFGLIALILTQYIFPNLKSVDLTLNTYSYGTLLIFCCLASVVLFFWIDRLKLNAREDKMSENNPRFDLRYIVKLGLLVSCSAIIIRLAQAVWKYGVVEQFPTPAEYSHYFAGFSIYSDIATLMTFSVFMFMSLCSTDRLARAWKNIYYAIACVSLILGLAFIVSVIFKFSSYGKGSTASPALPLEALNTVGASYQILVSSVIYPIVLCLKELAIVPIPSKNRFTAKLAIDLVFSKMTIFITSIGLTTLFTYYGATAAVFPIIAVIFFVIALTRFAFIYMISKQLIEETADPMLQYEIATKSALQ